jgi:hypothetical protein
MTVTDVPPLKGPLEGVTDEIIGVGEDILFSSKVRELIGSGVGRARFGRRRWRHRTEE